MSKSQTTAITTSAGSAQKYPVSQTAKKLNTSSPLIANQAMQQTLGSSTDTKQVTLPALVGNVPQDVTFTIPIAGFPSPFKLLAGSNGLVQASVSLVQPPSSSSIVIGVPALSLFFGTVQTAPGSGVWSLRSGVTYQAPALHVSVRIFSPTSTPAQKVTFVAHSTLLVSSP